MRGSKIAWMTYKIGSGTKYTGTHKQDAISSWLNEADWKNILWFAGSKHEILFGNHRCHVHWVMRKWNILHTFQKPASVFEWVHMTLAPCKSLEDLIYAGHFFLMEDIGDNVKPHSANIPTAWLCCKRVGVRSWNVCSHDQQYHLLKTSGIL